MSKYILSVSAVSTLLLALISAESYSAEYLVKTQKQYREAVKKLKAGDEVVLANGIWKDFEIKFFGKGNRNNPITLKAQDKGKVFLTGQSNLRIGGEFLVVSGLVFKDGYTPTSEVISFRKNKSELAYNSRVTETVIDNYSNPERFESDIWVGMYGQHNRFDHNHLEGKRNKGVTMAVRLDSEESRENHHLIDHNYFGPRPTLGANGGETLRIGTSHYSRSNSYTRVEKNYFDRCNGELEIISSKSGGNTFDGNVFYESRGTLTLRHGHGNLVENNVFIGNGVDHTGGIRVINKKQTVRNNYLEGLAGYRFGGALVVMNGVPNSPINRYDPVEDALIENNSIINSDHIQLAAGSDKERSAVPTNSVFKNNLISNDDEKDIFTIYDDISGIAFSGNILKGVEVHRISEGFINTSFELNRSSNGLLYPKNKSLAEVGAPKSLNPISKDLTGVRWYAKAGAMNRFGVGKNSKVLADGDALANAVNKASKGDVIHLSPGNYTVSKIIEVDVPITIKGDKRVNIEFERSTLFEIVEGGALKLDGLNISGKSTPDYVGNSVIRTSRYSMLKNYRVNIENCAISDLDVNRHFNFLSVSKSTMADNVEIRNSSFKNVSGAILKLNEEVENRGIYNAEYVSIANSSFKGVQGALIDLYRGGKDESTFGPHFSLMNSKIDNVGLGSNNTSSAAVKLHGVQVASIKNNIFKNSALIDIEHTVGEPVTRIVKNIFLETPGPKITELYSSNENTAIIKDNRY